VRDLRQSQSFFDELWQAILHANAWPQLICHRRTLFGYALDGAANFA